jgi:F5/8 type C domain
MRQFLCRITMSRAFRLTVCAGLFATLVAAAILASRTAKTNVASAKQGAVAIADSEFGRYTADQLIDGEWVRAGEPAEKNRWHSGQVKSYPHWIWIRFKQPAKIHRAVFHPADGQNYPIAMIGEFSTNDGTSFSTVFTITNNQLPEKKISFEKSFPPVVADNFRIRILRSSGNIEEAQLSEVEVFGKFVQAPQKPDRDVTNDSAPSLQSTSTEGLEISDRPAEIEFRSPWLRLAISKTEPRITALCWDNLGKGKVSENFLKTSPDGGVRAFQKSLFPEPWLPGANPTVRDGNVVRFSQTLSLSGNVLALWQIRVEPKSFTLSVTTTANEPIAVRKPFALQFAFDPSKTPVAPLGNPDSSDALPLPCLFHAPDYGTLLVRSTSDVPVCLRAEPAVRSQTQWNALLQVSANPRPEDGLFVQPAGQTHFELNFSVESTTPFPEIIANEPRLASLSRSWLNSFQYRPDYGILANNILSDNAPLSLFAFTDPAVFTPALPGNIQVIHLARESLDRYFSGATGYGIGREDIQADVYPSLLISAWDVIRVTGDFDRLRRWLPHLENIANSIEAQDRNGNGLPESKRSGIAGNLVRPTGNWWDVINFGHEDAYVCALDYRAFRCLADLERLVGRPEFVDRFEKRATRIRDAYVPAFLNPKTGILAGWKDSSGNLHDYCFVFVNALAITYGLVPEPLANSIVDRIETKLKEVGYTRFDLGLPGNLIPIRKADYIPSTFGAPQKEDGCDTFGMYQNGGASACYSYFYVQALYQLGRRAEAERILWPMVETFARGGFQNGVGHGGEWRQWNGKTSGYEGFLADAYYAQMAVFTGHYGITFGPEGFQLTNWSPLKGKSVQLGLQYMGKIVETVDEVNESNVAGNQPQ